MRRPLLHFAFFLLSATFVQAQVTLDADGAGNTYELINSVLAPGYDAVEVPDCGHTTFGRHIEETFDATLNTDVFRFIAHVTPDNDRCINFDRQRVEIKTYNQSPDNLKAVQGETVVYTWKFKIDANFQPSSSFTHIHQIKSVGGPYASIPMITLTLRKASPDRLELRYTPTNSQTTIDQAALSLFKGFWIEVTETIAYDDAGSYSIELKRVSDGQVLLDHSNNNMDTWQDGASFARPKWGIYRSLNNPADLRDEEMFFANFSIEEIGSLSVTDLERKADDILLTPNPSSDIIRIKNLRSDDYDSIHLYDSIGQLISLNRRLKRNKIDVSGLQTGLYYIVIRNNKNTAKVLKCMVE
ncbi:T9SS type A sorting domain-containing protein [Sungkyunkwania multivorans]|uniref:T9SS type A sorting domain-containing protein n=1 Tax=Sungkyunkwania multivorans TaxID=1173618 RepID=A0ABW3CVC1_9FLAO